MDIPQVNQSNGCLNARRRFWHCLLRDVPPINNLESGDFVLKQPHEHNFEL
jgi:hypothetical protein